MNKQTTLANGSSCYQNSLICYSTLQNFACTLPLNEPVRFYHSLSRHFLLLTAFLILRGAAFLHFAPGSTARVLACSYVAFHIYQQTAVNGKNKNKKLRSQTCVASEFLFRWLMGHRRMCGQLLFTRVTAVTRLLAMAPFHLSFGKRKDVRTSVNVRLFTRGVGTYWFGR